LDLRLRIRAGHQDDPNHDYDSHRGGVTMLSREDAIIGKRVKWISSDTRLSPTPGTITDVTDRGEGHHSV
jgi:hypothetical protein